MAFDSISNITLSKPTVKFYVNDWNLAVSLTTPTFNLILEPIYSINITLSNISLEASFVSDNIYSSSNILKKPRATFLVNNPNIWSLSATLPNPSVSILVGSNMQGVVNKRLPLISLDFESIFTATIAKQTWVFNTVTTAHSRYTNYEFNSFFKLGNINYGINDYGIYQLTGDTDFVGEASEVNIEAEVILPTTSFDEQTLKSCSDAIVYGRGDGYIEVALVLDEQQERTGYLVYYDDRTGMHRKRVKIPKGLKGSVWQFKIRNVNGSHFDINLFEVFIKSMQRLK